jgi:hypothetical protein
VEGIGYFPRVIKVTAGNFKECQLYRKFIQHSYIKVDGLLHVYKEICQSVGVDLEVTATTACIFHRYS